ncbi:type II secretion system F family protein [Planctomonas psychrotolerans]|uniref:type II secretion system F family protein n=1 Tax=Planctomonas psychrotolerans TaxID=2528712 RepID=UPI00123C0C08|nr:type II secretion system F family protein [Planctomonas psychrotolerans]
MTAAMSWALCLGVVLGLGLWSLASTVPRLGRPTLAARVAPSLLDVSDGARVFLSRRSIDPLPVLGTLLSPVLGGAARGLRGVLGGDDRVLLRLRQSGSTSSVERFRSEQLVWALVGAAAGMLIVVLSAAESTMPLAVQVAVPVVGAMAGLTLRDALLTRAATARIARITSEFPTVVEFLTLTLSAGEGVLDSLRRVARVSNGEFSRELAVVVADVHTGVALPVALDAMDRRLGAPPVTRLVEQLIAALERGSPLAEVLRAQAQDAREAAKRALLETAGKKEVAMLVPLVFLILPLTIAFAIFPGIVVLQTGF